MASNSKSSSSFLSKLNLYAEEGKIPPKFKGYLEEFYLSFKAAVGKDFSSEEVFLTVLDQVQQQIEHPFIFQPYHEKIREPFDYYKLGLDFLRPLVDMKHSTFKGRSHADEICMHLKNKHNVILLANHQTEADPQAMSILLEKSHPILATDIIFVAGERVVTDPLAIPFSMGRNLLCIYSKRYIDHPPEEKLKKQLHNKRTMELMSTLLSEGGKCIYVAPSGGRDRPNSAGVVEVAPFDPQSVEMLYLMAKKAKRPTFFYPLALNTYALLPPPQEIRRELGEARSTQKGAIHIAFGREVDMEHFPGNEDKDKHVRRKARANYIWNLVKEDYASISAL